MADSDTVMQNTTAEATNRSPLDDSEFEAAIAQAQLPGAIGIIVDREGVRYSRAVGLADAPGNVPMREDTPCQIASMTKALVSVAVMQLVEQGRMDLDEPVGELLPELASPQVITGFDDSGVPQTRPAKRPITMRHLLTHTSGLGYIFVQTDALRYFQHAGMPAPGSKASVTMPLLFDPGDAWEYGVSTDWAGLAVEAATGSSLGDYLREHICGPLNMETTGFFPTPPDNLAKVHIRAGNGTFETIPVNLGGGEFESGGGGLTSTAPDYARFVRAMLGGGELDGARILKAETVAEMGRNQIGDLRAGYMSTSMPDMSQPFDTFPDQHTGWGLGFLINPEPGPNGLGAGSLAWAGIFNSYYWIDPAAGIGGVFMSQLSPFGDQGALDAFGALERMAYG